jgi:DNA-binding response OmpR family regulator
MRFTNDSTLLHHSGPPTFPDGFAAEGAPRDGHGPREAHRRVLIVDDHQDSAEMLSMLVSAWGHDTRTAHDGLSAFDLAGVFRPEIILLDLTLPDIDGLELGRRLRTCSWAASLVLVAVTGWGRPSDRERSADAGFDAHLVKPVPLDVLQALIHNAGAPS